MSMLFRMNLKKFPLENEVEIKLSGRRTTVPIKNIEEAKLALEHYFTAFGNNYDLHLYPNVVDGCPICMARKKMMEKSE